MSRREFCTALFACLVLIPLLYSVGSVQGAPDHQIQRVSDHQSVNISDLDDDGDPDLAKFKADFGDERGTVLIVDRGDDMTRGEQPRQVINYQNDLLLYDINTDRVAELVIEFNKDSGTYPWKANLYDARAGDLSYSIESNGIDPPSVQDYRPTMSVSSRVPWINGNNVSYRLQLDCPSQVRCAFDDLYGGSANITVVDQNGDGVPEYEVRQIETGFSKVTARHKTELMVNTGTEQTIKSTSGLVWPYIYTDESKFYYVGEHPKPPISINWRNGTIAAVAEFVTSRSDEDNYFIYSQKRIHANKINDPSFEFPFAFYDLAEDNDRQPELQVRVQAHTEGSRSGLLPGSVPLPLDIAKVRYSWDQNNDDRWDYKLGLFGANGYSSSTTVGPYGLKMPRYQKLPEWVVSNEWAAVSFVAAPAGVKSGEGIYEGDALNARYALGLNDPSSAPLINHPQRGYRLEQNSRYSSKPKLYYSPIDDTLHLHNLEYGFWNRTTGPTIEYLNVDQDPYIDQWIEKDDDPQQLMVEDRYLIHSAQGVLSLKRTSVGGSRVTIKPPSNTSDWKQIDQNISADVNYTFDIKQTFQRYEGDKITIKDADLTEYVPVQNGFYLFASTSNKSRVHGNSSITLPQTKQVVLVSNESGINTYPATQPSISIQETSIAEESIRRLEKNTIEVKIKNGGWQTGDDLEVRLADSNEIITSKTVSVTGKKTERVQLVWWPVSDHGNLRIIIKNGSETVATNTLDAFIQERPIPSILNRFQVANPNTYISLGVLLLVLIGTVLTARRVTQ